MGELLLVIPGALLIGTFAGSIAVYVNDRERRGGNGRSIIFFSTGALLAGVLACWFVAVPTVTVYCRVFPTEQCNWIGGVVGVSLFFSLAVATFVYFWAKHGRQS